MANSANQSRTCPVCGEKFSIIGAKVLAKSKTTQRALKLIQIIKHDEKKDVNQSSYRKFKD
mgnify:CR=1 FL=1|jgi:hypothetical protein